ncbi:MAG: hypothetical protein J3Q66DRAFT_393767 [Benniella sp.]|nr:MAG: hypothetical protein J3Q66DRAFT_393767 [Benniella sp.]
MLKLLNRTFGHTAGRPAAINESVKQNYMNDSKPSQPIVVFFISPMNQPWRHAYHQPAGSTEWMKDAISRTQELPVSWRQRSDHIVSVDYCVGLQGEDWSEDAQFVQEMLLFYTKIRDDMFAIAHDEYSQIQDEDRM